MKLDLYDYNVGQIVGPKNDMVRFLQSYSCKENAETIKEIVSGLPDHEYVSIDLVQLEGISYSELKDKVPSCELFVYYGLDKYDTGMGTYNYSSAGNKEIEEDFFFKDSTNELTDSSGGCGWETAIFKEFAIRASLTVNLTDGKSFSYTPCDTSLLSLLVSQPLTMGLLSKICNPYIKTDKRNKFTQSLKSDIIDVENISSLEYRISKERVFQESDIQTIYQEKIAPELGDCSVLRYLNSRLTEEKHQVFDYTDNTLRTLDTSVISCMKNPAMGNYEYIRINRKVPSHTTEPLAGFAPADSVDILWQKKDEGSSVCENCLSDFEEIRVPDQFDGLKVTVIKSGCFEKLNNVKKVILPNTIKTIEKNAFSACKKLTSVVYAAQPDSREDFMILSKGKLITLITAKTSYTVPDTISEIGKNAFSNCMKLKKLTLRSGMKRLLNDSLAECKSLKTIDLTNNPDDINISALEKAGIKEMILPDGSTVTIYDKCMWEALAHSPDGMVFSYQKAAENLHKVKTESAKFKFALDILSGHSSEVDETVLSSVYEFALQHAIGTENPETVSKILDMNIPVKMDFSFMLELADHCNKPEISALLLQKSGQAGSLRKTVIRQETPAEPLPGSNRQYIKVRFENNKAYSYFCKYNVKIGDKVYVPGKMAGMPGEVIDILKNEPSGRAAMYTLEVTDAFSVTMQEVDDDLEL